jgi:Fic family protein
MGAAIQSRILFQGEPVPADASLIGWSALVHRYGVNAPVRQPSCVSRRHVKGNRRVVDGWVVFDKRFAPALTLAGQLSFALRHERLDLLVLKRIFDAVEPAEIAAMVRDEPSGANTRRAWFLYEWLTSRRAGVPDAAAGNYVDLLDPERYFVAEAANSPRHRIRGNLLGTPDFCPVIRRTPKLDELVAKRLDAKAAELVARIDKAVVARAASFLLLADSMASFEIEGERPPRNRIERWCRAVARAGKRTLTLEEILHLHALLIEDDRFVTRGLRPDGVFLGERDHGRNPIPEFIGARPSDLPSLMEGVVAAHARMARGAVTPPVLAAAAVAFGFVYIHPFQDGNGRIHRCLVNQVLTERRFSPPGMVFPVSMVMLDRIDAYRATLQAHSGPLMDFIDWRPTATGNVDVSNDTADLYRYFDATENAEFLFGCVERTIERDLPDEIDHLRRFDEAKRRIQDMIEMPDNMLSDLIMFIRQNEGVLPRRRRQTQFGKLTDAEVADVEAIVRGAFEIDPAGAANGRGEDLA